MYVCVRENGSVCVKERQCVYGHGRSTERDWISVRVCEGERERVCEIVCV